MSLLYKNPSMLSQIEKINSITKDTPQLSNHLKQNIFTLSPEKLDRLHKLSLIEKQAQIMAKNLNQGLTNASSNFDKIIQNQLDKLTLTNQKHSSIQRMYKQTILSAVNKTLERYISNKYMSNTHFLLQSTINTIDSISAFQKAINKNHPDLSKNIIDASIYAINSILIAYSPAIGLLVYFSGVLEHVGELLKNVDFKKELGKLNVVLKKITENKLVINIKQYSTKLLKLAEKIQVSPDSIGKIKLSLKDLTSVTEEVDHNKNTKLLLQELCQYVDKNLPENEKQINENFSDIKSDIITELRKLKISDDVLRKVTKALDKSITQAKDKVQNTLNPDKEIFDKIISTQQSTEIMEKSVNKIRNIIRESYPNKNDLNKFIKVIDRAKKKIIHGDLDQITRYATRTNLSKEPAKVKSDFVSKILSQRSISNKKPVSRMVR